MIWDVALRKHLSHAGSAFRLDVAFRSDARRLALLGPSGAGKTMTLRMIAGVVRPDRGRIAVAGRCVFDADAGIDLAAKDRHLACVFQDYALFPHLTVQQNIAFGRSRGLRNPHRQHADDVTRRWIEALHLQPVAGHLPHQISGGQRQRTALARALASEPAALLLDEPFAALDRPLRERLRAELRELQQDIGIPTLLITHDEDDAAELADDRVRLLAGRVSADGHDTAGAASV